VITSNTFLTYSMLKPGITSNTFLTYSILKPGITSSMYVIIQSGSYGLSECAVFQLIQACRMNTFCAPSRPTQPVCFVVALLVCTPLLLAPSPVQLLSVCLSVCLCLSFPPLTGFLTTCLHNLTTPTCHCEMTDPPLVSEGAPRI
jgi:hypothetical protein